MELHDVLLCLRQTQMSHCCTGYKNIWIGILPSVRLMSPVYIPFVCDILSRFKKYLVPHQNRGWLFSDIVINEKHQDDHDIWMLLVSAGRRMSMIVT
jgi:hypothetical protein